jgi:hypothetical protein
VDKTQSEQPRWMTPIATTTPRLEEEVRYDQDWLQHTDGYRWDEYDGAKGLEIIPWYKTEIYPPGASVLRLPRRPQREEWVRRGSVPAKVPHHRGKRDAW